MEIFTNTCFFWRLERIFLGLWRETHKNLELVQEGFQLRTNKRSVNKPNALILQRHSRFLLLKGTSKVQIRSRGQQVDSVFSLYYLRGVRSKGTCYCNFYRVKSSKTLHIKMCGIGTGKSTSLPFWKGSNKQHTSKYPTKILTTHINNASHSTLPSTR